MKAAPLLRKSALCMVVHLGNANERPYSSEVQMSALCTPGYLISISLTLPPLAEIPEHMGVREIKSPSSSASSPAAHVTQRKEKPYQNKTLHNECVFFSPHAHPGEDESKHVMRTEIVTSLNALLDGTQPAR